MINEPIIRKAKLHFDTAPHPPHVTFDDGQHTRRNLPWHAFTEARWDHTAATVIKVIIGDWQVELRGHNLAALFQAIEDNSLTRVRALPELKNDATREIDTFVTEILFTKLRPGIEPTHGGQGVFDLSG